jgi:hypothetical protein
MMKQVFRLTVCVLGLTLLASQAFAQALPWEGRGFATFNFGMQVKSASVVTSNDTFPLYDETGKVSIAQTIDTQAPFIEFGGGFRVKGNFGVGISYSRLSTDGSAIVKAEVPSPLVYDQFRTTTSTTTGLEHVEQSFHFQALWLLPITDKLQVMFSAGPTLFQLTQGTVTTPSVTEVGPPYTTVNVTTATASTTGSHVGVNVGADLTYRLTNMFGVGAMMRYASATVSITPQSGSPLDVKVGGFQIGAGLRVRF